MNRKIKVLIIKYITYVAVFLLLYLVQVTPGFLQIFGIKPLIILPAVVCLAMHERELVGGLLGALGGMLCDLSSFTYFGFNAIMFLLMGIAVGLLVEYMMKESMGNAVFFTLCGLVIQMIVSFFFQYGIWSYEDTGRLWLWHIIPCICYSLVYVPPLFLMFRKLSRFFGTRTQV